MHFICWPLLYPVLSACCWVGFPWSPCLSCLLSCHYLENGSSQQMLTPDHSPRAKRRGIRGRTSKKVSPKQCVDYDDAIFCLSVILPHSSSVVVGWPNAACEAICSTHLQICDSIVLLGLCWQHLHCPACRVRLLSILEVQRFQPHRTREIIYGFSSIRVHL